MTLWEEIRWVLFCYILYLWIIAELVCCYEGMEIEYHHIHKSEADHGHIQKCEHEQ